MGDVWLAARADEPQQRVALKVIRPVPGVADLVPRFLRERRLLARLEHPGIARLVDGGETEAGQLYLAVEYVEGQQLDLHCTSRGLTLRERLELFVRACQAVQFAHQALVVHRDLKPANILVDAEGQPKLVDFGIAKLLEAPQGAADEPLTTIGCRRPLTEAYASPEQLRGEPVTTACDVYALGVILHELITGSRPFELAGRSPAERERLVCEETPPPPSTRLATHREHRAVSGDLDTIVLEALRKEPERRYATAGQLARDVELHLAGRPITARADTLRYRATKFLRRNRLAVGALTTVFLALVTALVASGVLLERARASERLERTARRAAQGLAEQLRGQVARAEEAETAERAAREQAEEVFDELLELSVSNVFAFGTRLQRMIGGTRIRAAMLEASTQQLERLAAAAAERREIRYALCKGLLLLGDVQGNPNFVSLARTEDALASYQRALEVAEELYSSEPRDAEAAEMLGQAHTFLGEMARATGEPGEKVRTHLLRAQALREELVEMRPGDREAALLLAGAHDRLGTLHLDASEWAASEELARAALEILLELAAVGEPDDLLASYLANTRWKLASALQGLGRSGEAEESFREALRWSATLVERRPDHPFYFRQRAVLLCWFGKFLYERQRYEEAREVLEQASERYAELHRRDPDQQSTAWDWSLCLRILARVELEQALGRDLASAQGRPDWGLARRHLARAIELLEPHEQRGALHGTARQHLAEARELLGRCDDALGSHEEPGG